VLSETAPPKTAPSETAQPIRSTYRLQLHAGFPFAAAAAVVDYLADLGVSHAYCSPYLQAAPGSTHGYDVVDHSRVNSELGGEDGRAVFVRRLAEHGLGHVLDVVPNHVSVAAPRSNRWWWDVLSHGSASPWTGWFDIDYDLAHADDLAERGRLVVPVLGDDGLAEVRLVEEDGELLLAYHDHRFPVADGTAASVDDDVAAVHDRQHYVLVDWRRGSDQLNYRRFFDVSDLASIRVEDARVFTATHELVLGWLADGSLAGLRVDHPDGLADPRRYLERIQEAAPGTWVVVEKILEPGEALPAAWPCAGTTGYDALREVGGLFVDPAGEQPLTDGYARLTGEPVDWEELVHDRKLAAATSVLHAEIQRLASLVVRLGSSSPDLADLEHDSVVEAFAELAACLPVYRTYLRALHDADPHEVAVLAGAVDEAARRRPDLAGVLKTVEHHLVAPRPGLDAELATRFQQTSGMVMAKGVEDTAFYRYHRLVALNEVGGSPGAFGVGLAAFHDGCAARARDWPSGLTALSTHDTKRGEDVRARLALLSEIPAEWLSRVEDWGLDRFPDRNVGYLFWQTLVGAWPLTEDRAQAYLEKATREAKQHTSWVDPDPAYDDALRAAVAGVFSDSTLMADVEEFVERLAPAWQVTAVAQKLVQLTMPGIPDVYQGSELWELSLVDPDNRRPVDYDLRRRLLAELDTLSPEQVWERADEGLPKLFAVRAALRLRQQRPAAFAGDHAALEVAGGKAPHLVAFVRGGEVITLAPRLVLGLAGDWADTTVRLPAGSWRDELTGERHEAGVLPVAELLGRLPVALLSRQQA
jgi:(1->4)-alpha-D-glucan 1-alpha-D-glucosylmutase